MSARLGRRGRGDAGATLPELLMAIVLSTIVTGVAAGALIVSFGRDTEATTRLDESHNAQLLSIYLPADVESARLDGAVKAPADEPLSCPGTVEGANILSLGRPGGGYHVSYRVKDQELLRFACLENNSRERLIVARNLDPENPPVVDIEAGGTRVSMEVRERSGLTYTVTASRRTPASSSPPTEPSPPTTPLPAGPCDVDLFEVTPSTVGLDAAGRPDAHLTITLETHGVCELNFTLVYDPDSTPLTSETRLLANEDFDGVRGTTILPRDHTWTAGPKVLEVFTGEPTSTPAASANLLVLPHDDTPPPCSVATAAAEPNPVQRNANDFHLASSLTINVELTGTCLTPPKVRFTPGDSGSALVDMVGSGLSWTVTIDAAAYNWTLGSKPVTVIDAGGDPLAVDEDLFTVTAPPGP